MKDCAPLPGTGYPLGEVWESVRAKVSEKFVTNSG